MANKLLNKVLYFIGLEGEEQQSAEATVAATNNTYDKEEIDTDSFLNQKNNKKVFNIYNNSSQVKVFIFEPKAFEEAPVAVDNIKNKKPVILNLENIDKEVAKKIFDFLSGAIYAVDGNIQKINGNIFLLAPNNVDILAHVKEDLKNKNLFPWQK